ncbi:MAG TPA: hypothetical protein VK961_11205 [Chthoniobacter sp.]|nr:hypothetical protein [Chthoniobacter sp.]
MKYLPSIIVIGLFTFALHAQNAVPPEDKGDPFVKNAKDAGAAKDDDTWKQCVITLETYAVDREDAASLLNSERGSAARYRRVQELAKAGKARLDILENVTTKSGQRTVIESIDEVRYATEFASPVTAKGQAAPTAWETRNVGDTFELEPVINPDGRTCDINLVPQRVNLLEFRDAPNFAGALLTSQPIFNTQKLTTSIQVTSGEPYYLGTMTPTTPHGIARGETPSEIWLAFLHVNIQGPPPAKPQPKPKTQAKEGDEQATPPVELQYSCYSLDRATAREILISPSPMNMPWEKVTALVAEKKARLEHITTIKTKSGQRAVVEEIQEVRYMTEYQPEHHATLTENTTRTVTNQVGEAKPNQKSDSTSTSTEQITTTRTDPHSEVIPGQASAFENRNAGVTAEVEPVVGPDQLTIDLNHVIQSVKLVGQLKVTGTAAQYPPMPLFETAKVTTSQSVQVGLPILVSTLNPPGADGVNDRTDSGRTYLLFVRATLDEP